MQKLKIIRDPVSESVFEAEVNAFLEEHEDAKASFPEVGVAYIVYGVIDYDKKVREMEARYHIRSETPVTDEYELEGIRYLCKECPYLEVGSDKRRKTWPCKYATYGMSRKDSGCCEYFYKQLKQGLVKPIVEEAEI